MNFKTFLAVMLCVLSIGASAQNEQRRARMNTTEMYNRQAERLAKTMKLDDEKTQLFTILYLDYQAARHNAANPKGENEKEDKIDMKKLTDEKAMELINLQFARTEAQLKVDKEYLAKFLEILTPAQAANIYVQRMRGMNGGDRPQGDFRGPRGGGFGGGGFGGGDFGGGFGGGF